MDEKHIKDTYYAVYSHFDDDFCTPLCGTIEELAEYIKENDIVDPNNTERYIEVDVMRIEVMKQYTVESKSFLCKAGKQI